MVLTLPLSTEQHVLVFPSQRSHPGKLPWGVRQSRLLSHRHGSPGLLGRGSLDRMPSARQQPGPQHSGDSLASSLRFARPSFPSRFGVAGSGDGYLGVRLLLLQTSGLSGVTDGSPRSTTTQAPESLYRLPAVALCPLKLRLEAEPAGKWSPASDWPGAPLPFPCE